MNQNRDRINQKRIVKVSILSVQNVKLWCIESKKNDFKRPEQVIDVESLKGML